VGNCVQITTDGGYIIAGYKGMVEGTGMGKTAWLIKTTRDPLSRIEDHTRTISAYWLSQNYPNPFNPITKINYQLPKTSNVELSIYNLLGQKVATLVSGKQNAGSHQVEWDASHFASGIYYYRIQVVDPARRTGEFQDVKKMIPLR
jgi:hypothetical protein